MICLIESKKFSNENDERLLNILENICSVQHAIPNYDHNGPELKNFSLNDDKNIEVSFSASNPRTPSTTSDVQNLRVELLANYVVLSYLTLLFNSYDVLACARALCITNFNAFLALRRAFQTSKLSPYQV